MDKLSEIMEWKRREIADRIRIVDESELEAFNPKRATGRFIEALQAPSGLAVISEIKRRSPSAGQIKALGASTEQADTYLSSGADCLSILTDEKFFGGQLADLENVTRKFADDQRGIPCLRKDFMVHPIQVLEAAQAGASAVLIIVRALSDEEMKVLREAADLAGLDVCLDAFTNIWTLDGKPDGKKPPEILKRMVAEGKLGRKTGEGFYKYDARGKMAGVAVVVE